ncbi:MAG: GNAT family N-acetyltransferase [Gammaproteobacteria bacterium]
MITAEFTVRRATIADSTTLVAFNQAMAQETENRELATEIIAAGVTGLLQAPQYGFYLVAHTPAQVIGSLLVTYEWSDWRNGPIWWLQSVYVVPEWRGRGVYRELYLAVKNLAHEQGNVRGFRLYVDADNRTAQLAYTRLGMRQSHYLLYEDMAES